MCIQKFKSLISKTLFILHEHVAGHAHSPIAASIGEDHPIHLKRIIGQYQKVLAYVEPVTLRVSKLNYEIQKIIVGSNDPIGNDSTDNSRDSTREENKKNRVTLVECKMGWRM